MIAACYVVIVLPVTMAVVTYILFEAVRWNLRPSARRRRQVRRISKVP